MLAHLEELARERGKFDYLVFLPTTSGPCRFGQIRRSLEDILAQLGYEGLPVLGPSSDSGYLDFEVPAPLKGFFKRAIIQIFNAIKMSDMLDDLVRRFRPYCRDRPPSIGFEKGDRGAGTLDRRKRGLRGHLKGMEQKILAEGSPPSPPTHMTFPRPLCGRDLYQAARPLRPK